MKASEAKELFRTWTEKFFSGYEVVYTNQSRAAKPAVPLVTIAFGNAKRPPAPTYTIEDGSLEGHYQSRVSVVIDLFTNGRPITDDTGITAYENTALDEMLAYCDYLNGVITTQWCRKHNLAILIEKEAQDITGAVNDNNYEYRARQELYLYYMHRTDRGINETGYFEETNISENA